MARDEARAIARGQLRELRGMTWLALRDRYLDRPETVEIEAPSGQIYQVETSALWDGPERGNLRVMVAVDDGGWRAIVPLCDDFIVAPDGSFIGE